MPEQVLVSQLLRAAKDRIKTRSSWTQGALARSAEGFSVMPESRFAMSRCTMGALYAALGSSRRQSTLVFRAERYLSGAINEKSVSQLNDFGTFEEVHAMFDRAIQNAEADEAQGHGG